MIREATKNDAKQIASIIIRSWQTAYKGLVDDTFLESISMEKMSVNWGKNISSADEKNNIFVYEDNNKILGVIRFGTPDDKEDKSHNAEIQVLYVEPSLKRKGIGSRLFKFAKEYFIDNEKQNLIIWCLKGNDPAISFYKKMGGKLVAERKSKVNNLSIEEVGFEFKLPDKIELVKPTKEYEKQAIEYKKEHFENGEMRISACSKWYKIDSYDEWLKLLKDCSKKETLPEDWTVSTQFFGVRKKDNKIVGMIQIRHELVTEFLKNYAGHIGYGVRPTERRKGYVTQMLKQTLRYCKEELKLEKVMISCAKENEGSKKTIVNAGGILEREYKTEDGENVEVYWIKLI